MKYIKRSSINETTNPMNDKFAVYADDRIVTNTKVSFQFPSGTDEDRPIVNVNGMIRYSKDLYELEVYNGHTPGIGWEKVRTVRPAPIYVNDLGFGDYENQTFGPLKFNAMDYMSDFTRPQNIFVYIENVFQHAGENYTLIQTGGNQVSILFTDAPPGNKKVRAYVGYDGYFPDFPTP
jgi:hypothetical protein